jgi:tetratricopeptide (TPR) repeat protein
MDAPSELPRTAATGAKAPTRSETLESGAREADRHTQAGFDLAGRGAHFAARAEFIATLRILAQSLDAEEQSNSHSRSLAQGLTALRELREFIPNSSQLETDLDLGGIIARHQTPVLKQVSASALTPLAAFQAYLVFGQERLATAVGREVAGSMALHGLGKLHLAMAKSQVEIIPTDRAKAVLFYQAALTVWPQNYMAANDLGVALAQGGRYDAARATLEQSVLMRPQAAGLHNLSVVYDGESEGSSTCPVPAARRVGRSKCTGPIRRVQRIGLDASARRLEFRNRWTIVRVFPISGQPGVPARSTLPG